MIDTSREDDALYLLLLRVLDSAKGYEEAAAAADDGRFANTFRDRAARRRTFVAELMQALQLRGVEVRAEHQLLSQISRRFPAVRRKLDFDDEAVRDEIIDCENWLLSVYQAALQLQLGSSHQIVTAQAHAVNTDIDTIRTSYKDMA